MYLLLWFCVGCFFNLLLHLHSLLYVYALLLRPLSGSILAFLKVFSVHQVERCRVLAQFNSIINGCCMWFPTQAWQTHLNPCPETYLPFLFWACLEQRLIIVCWVLTRSEQRLAGNPPKHFLLQSWKILLSIKFFRIKYTKEEIVEHSSAWIRMLSRSTVIYFGSNSTNIWVYT